MTEPREDLGAAIGRLRRTLEDRMRHGEAREKRRAASARAPAIDRDRFARDLRRALDRAGLSLAAAEARLPGVNRAMLSRALNGRPVALPTFLVLVKQLRLRPLAYLVLPEAGKKTKRKQSVTVPVPCETGGAG